METKELRIGNYVTINNIFSHEKMLNIPLVVCGIEKLREQEGGIIRLNYPNENDNFVIPAFCQFDKFINPIQLTEEILWKCGFNKSNGHGYRSTKIAGVIMISNCGCFFNYFYYDIQIKIEYVHQFQNLYFALTGEELEINL